MNRAPISEILLIIYVLEDDWYQTYGQAHRMRKARAKISTNNNPKGLRAGSTDCDCELRACSMNSKMLAETLIDC